jgi:hypothetical protein
MADPGRSARGEIEALIERGELEEVEPSAEHSNLLMAQAVGHLGAAEQLVLLHPPSAFTLLYEAARKAMTAVLAKQGLRPMSHVAVHDAIAAQLGPGERHVVQEFETLHTRRNQSEYRSPDDLPVTSEEAAEALDEVGVIVQAMVGLLPAVGPFR